MNVGLNRYQESGQRARQELDALGARSTVTAEIEARLFSGRLPRAEPPRRFSLRLGFGVGAVAVAAVAIALGWPVTPVSFTIAEEGTGNLGAPIVAGSEQKLVAFSEGTTLAIRPRAHARVIRARANGADVTIDEGTVGASVTPRKAGRWVFRAGPYEVVVTGTRFDLTWDAAARRLTVAMREGRVIVSGGILPAPREVRAGEVLTAGEQGPAVVAARAQSVSAVVPAVVPAVVVDQAPPEAPRAADPGRQPVRAAAAHAQDLNSPAGALFARADGVRLAGDERQAVVLFERVAKEFPADRLAGLAAFAAGRLRLLRLDDPRGALVDLQRARRRGLGAALAEDCQARIVEALGRLGDHAGCAHERAQYLAAFPQGTHALAVARACD